MKVFAARIWTCAMDVWNCFYVTIGRLFGETTQKDDADCFCESTK